MRPDFVLQLMIDEVDMFGCSQSELMFIISCYCSCNLIG